MPDPPKVPFEIVRQHMVTEPNDQGNLQTNWKVHFRTPSGTESHVTLPDDAYSAENVAALVHHKASEIEKVHALSTPLQGQ